MQNERLAATFAALADPTRLGILARLAKGEASVSRGGPAATHQPAGGFETPQGAGACGADHPGRDAQWRPCRIDAGGLREIADWIAPYRDLWEARFDLLADHLRTMQADKSRRARTGRQGRGSGRR